MNFVQIHDGLFRASLIFSLIIAGYGFWLFFRRKSVDGNYWGILATGELLFLAQGVAGLAIFFLFPDLRPVRSWQHMLYGAVLTLTIPGAYAYLRGKDERREVLMYALIGLFLAGVTLRAQITAGR